MALVVTPEVFVDLMRLCLAWEWEHGLERQNATHNRERIVYATQVGWTTVDKIARILHGLGIVSKKQRSALYKDRRVQQLVLRNSDTYAGYDDNIDSVLSGSKRDFVFLLNHAETVNREKMLRNTRFYISQNGYAKISALATKYSRVITKDSYVAEIEKQHEDLPERKGAQARIFDDYQQRVKEETQKK